MKIFMFAKDSISIERIIISYRYIPSNLFCICVLF